MTAEARLLQARSVGLSYGPTRILQDLDLDIAPGDEITISGRSGSGKTSLLLILAGLLPPSQGSVTWPGLAGTAAQRRHQIGMVFQAPSLMPELTALENVSLPLRLRGTASDEARTSSLRALEHVRADDLADALPAQLSGGQQQRVAIARALAGDHRLVLADEPTGALDRSHAREAAEALRDGVRASGGALVLATHDPELADMLGRRLVVVDRHLVEKESAR
jgi:ABC-type lipoprotein export system ATPase subunit